MVPEICRREDGKRYRTFEVEIHKPDFILSGNNFVIKAESLNLSGLYFLSCEMKSLDQAIA